MFEVVIDGLIFFVCVSDCVVAQNLEARLGYAASLEARRGAARGGPGGQGARGPGF